LFIFPAQFLIQSFRFSALYINFVRKAVSSDYIRWYTCMRIRIIRVSDTRTLGRVVPHHIPTGNRNSEFRFGTDSAPGGRMAVRTRCLMINPDAWPPWRAHCACSMTFFSFLASRQQSLLAVLELNYFVCAGEQFESSEYSNTPYVDIERPRARARAMRISVN
jgi:hypothetical protein